MLYLVVNLKSPWRAKSYFLAVTKTMCANAGAGLCIRACICVTHLHCRAQFTQTVSDRSVSFLTFGAEKKKKTKNSVVFVVSKCSVEITLRSN